MKRRSFLQSMAVGAGVVTHQACHAQPPAVAEKQKLEAVAGMPRRTLGRTGRRVSIICYPGFALRNGGGAELADPAAEHGPTEEQIERARQAACTASIRHALDNGVNYFDVAPAYDKLRCEQRMGRAFAEIEGFRRESIFLACKTRARDRDGARAELERSLKHLRTEYFDLYQLHCLEYPDKDVDVALGQGGAMEAIREAQQEGKVRAIGFSAHTTKAAVAALRKFPFDTVMFPLNFVEMFKFGFGKQVLELARQTGAAAVAIKAMSDGAWPEGMTPQQRPRKWWYKTLEEQDTIDLAMRFILSQPPVVAAISPAWLDLAAQSIEAGKNFRPATEDDKRQLQARAKDRLSEFLKRDQVACRGPAGQRFHDPHGGCPGAMC